MTDSSDNYNIMHASNFHKKSPGSVFDIKQILPITIIDPSCSNQKYYLRDILYIPLEEAYKLYVLENNENYPSPYHHLKIFRPDILKERIMTKILYKNISDRDIIRDTNTCFQKFCEEKYYDDYENNLIFLENTLYFDDHLLSDWINSSDLREKSIQLIEKSSDGSWLVRKSSVIEQLNVKPRVITFKNNKNIYHYLVAHIDGFGYITTHTFSGDTLPKIGENKPITITNSFSSIPSLLMFMKTQGLILQKLVKNDNK